MKLTLLASVAAASLSFAATQPLLAQDEKPAEESAEAMSAEENAEEMSASDISYALGMLIGESIKEFEEIDYERLSGALETQHQGGETEMNLTEAQQTMQKFQMAVAEAAAAEASAAGEAFLAENEAREGVEVTDSGLQYEVVSEADGPKPTAEDTVKVHYEGTLTDGTVFDSSVQRGEPAQFPLKGVIPGWTEGLQLMSVGSKYRFVIPSDLAYGERGAGQAIGPGETLVFDVELLEIVDQ